jgi:hypothetical protein
LQNYFFQINVNLLTQPSEGKMKIIKDIFEVIVLMAAGGTILMWGTILEAIAQ